jgi:hypothetical protein
MARTTADEVREIIPNCTLTDEQVEPMILDKVFLNDTTLSASQREEIERWFTAHLLVFAGFLPGLSVKMEKIGDAEIQYAAVGKTGAGLDSTPFGQMAKILDTSGLLGASGKMKASIYAVKSFEE